MYEYKVEQCNGKWYVWQFNVYKKLEAHAKLDNVRQLALWIELQENDCKYSGNEAIMETIEAEEKEQVKIYTVTV